MPEGKHRANIGSASTITRRPDSREDPVWTRTVGIPPVSCESCARRPQCSARPEESPVNPMDFDSDNVGHPRGRHSTTVLVLDPGRARERYHDLQEALPFVQFHFDVESLPHPAILRALSDSDGYFEINASERIADLESAGVQLSRVVFEQPGIDAETALSAYCAGIRTFVVGSFADADAFDGFPGSLRLMVRLRYGDNLVHGGLTPSEAAVLVRYAHTRGIRIAGFSFHLGATVNGAQPFAAAISRTIGLMSDLEAELGCRFDLLDIGGGFPPAREPLSARFSEVARAIRVLLLPIADRMTILAEPGLAVAEGCFTLEGEVTSRALSPVLVERAIAAGATVVVTETRPVQPTFFRTIADTRHRIFTSSQRGKQTRVMAGSSTPLVASSAVVGQPTTAT
jgi:ornithine decarboxylase